MRRALIALAALACAAGAAAAGPQCFTAADLAFRPGEEVPVKRSAAASVSLPDLRKVAASRVRPGLVRRVELPEGERLVALTFDLCETGSEVAGYDGRIVDILRARGAHATFFAGGHWLLTHQGRAAQLMSDPLFEVGNHTWTHRILEGADAGVLRAQILAPQAAYETVRARLAAPACAAAGGAATAPERPVLFRFPAGRCDPAALEAVADAGLTAIQWDIETGDPAPGASASEIVARVLARVRPGSIIVAHANGRGWHTAEALPRLLDALEARGLRPVTVSELLERGRPVYAEACPGRRPPPDPVAARGGGHRPRITAAKLRSRRGHGA